MRAFLDFEASSLGKHGVPIEVAWAWEDGRSEAHLIRPAPGWDDWDAAAEAIHGVARTTLTSEGTDHAEVAQRMVAVLGGHDLFASAPSWDGKWLSALLRAAGLPRHALRLRDTEEAQAEIAREMLSGVMPADRRETLVDEALRSAAAAWESGVPAHRALADAQAERRRWLLVRDHACAAAERERGQVEEC